MSKRRRNSQAPGSNKKNVPLHLRKDAKRCIFCNEPGLSATHIWPDWLNRLLPSPSRQITSDIIGTVTSENIELVRDWTTKQGGVFSQKPKLACVTCNTGWMNKVEQDVIAFLRPVIASRSEFKLNDQTAQSIATWIGLITILSEFIASKDVAISAAERRFVYRYKRLPADWLIFIGSHNSKSFTSNYTHYAWWDNFIDKNHLIPLVRYKEGRQSQTSTFGIGPLVIRVLSGPTAIATNDFIADCVGHGMRQLWPFKRLVWPFPYKHPTLAAAPLLSDDAIWEVAEGFTLRFQHRTELRRPRRFT